MEQKSPYIDPDHREHEMALLQRLGRDFPNVDAALAEIARLSALLTLRKGTIHIISDIHGEDKKLRHVINNASGTLRPLVEQLFKDKLEPRQFQDFLNFIFYPAEVAERLETTMKDPAELTAYAQRTLRDLFVLVRHLASRWPLKKAMAIFPSEFKDLLAELLNEPTTERGESFEAAIVKELIKRGRVFPLLHLTSRLVRNLAVYELVIGGDCWDRGPRGDRVVEYLRHQPHVTVVWGNHDAAWMGACLGHEALIAHVLRVSLRYRRLSQLEEGYGITLQPLEYLARTVYANDPASCYGVKGDGLRPTIDIARMQKAAAIMQFKLEGQMIARNPQWKMDHRRLMHRINYAAGTIDIDGKTYKLLDTHFPTIDPANPYELSADEKTCMERTRESFMASQKLWEHIQYIVRRGCMYLVRDQCLVFHGCVAVDPKGDYLPLTIDDHAYCGRLLFNKIEKVVVRALDERQPKDLDLLWYLWSGPLSPLFGKDRITTLESYLIAEKETHEEHKNPYFNLIHEADFCDKILAEFSVDPKVGLIVNGHVPVKIEKGENPIKRSGKAITIDGAFSEAYGDHGYTLVLESDRTVLAEHHHFESVDAAIREGVDIVPKVTVVRTWDPPRLTTDTEEGEEWRCQIELLERLIEAYRGNQIRVGAAAGM
jgi:fructose-1,6-bisphosphatase-3